MNIDTIEQDFKEKVGNQIHLISEGVNRYRVSTPFMFEDGDHLVIILKHIENYWRLSDEGHTYMHLTYDLEEKDLQKGTRQTIITNALSMFGIRDSDGELLIDIQNNNFGDGLFSLIQAILHIFDVTFLSRERVRSTFMEDFQTFIEEKVPPGRYLFNWYDLHHDPGGFYRVDCRINHMSRPILIFAINSDDKARDATIALLQYERWGVPFQSLAIFENQEEINRKVLARLSDVAEKQFSSLDVNRDRIVNYFEAAINAE